jgi:alkylation response protein AidB-like acyl-CoA dehydrogenase
VRSAGAARGGPALQVGRARLRDGGARLRGLPLSRRQSRGRENRGLLDALHTLTLGRIASAAFATGLARAALVATLGHVRERKQFGQPIGSFQAVRFGIADMALQIEASRLLCHRAAIAADRGLAHGREASMAKLYATEACTRLAERAAAGDDRARTRDSSGYDPAACRVLQKETIISTKP